jgi:2-polyprenyl-3-methyl-5-hydroxy-6-metoxy-1,4-benzoquinol methylase
MQFLENQSGPRVQADGADLPFLSESLDKLSLLEVIEHVPQDAFIKMLQEARRVITPDGRVIISTPNKGAYGNKLSSPDHIKEYEEQELKLIIAASGFIITEQYGQGFLKEGSVLTKIIRSARDSHVVSWLYYHGPLFLRNILRIGLQKAVKSDEIRTPEKDETIKNFIFILKPNPDPKH